MKHVKSLNLENIYCFINCVHMRLYVLVRSDVICLCPVDKNKYYFKQLDL